MDMNSPFSRAWSVTWYHKYLWLLGLVAGLRLNYGDDTVGMLQGGARLFLDASRYLIPSSVGAVLMVLVSLVFWLLGLVVRAGLIQSVSDIERRKTPQGIAASFQNYMGILPSLAVMQIIVWSPLIIANLLAVALLQQFEVGVTFFLVIVFIFVVLAFIEAFAFRSIVLGRLNPLRGIAHGIQTLMRGFGNTLLIAVVYGMLAILFIIIIGIPLTAIGTILLAPMTEAQQMCLITSGSEQELAQCSTAVTQSPTYLFPAIVLGGISAVLMMVLTTFQSALFTIAYEEVADFSTIPAQKATPSLR